MFRCVLSNFIRKFVSCPCKCRPFSILLKIHSNSSPTEIQSDVSLKVTCHWLVINCQCQPGRQTGWPLTRGCKDFHFITFQPCIMLRAAATLEKNAKSSDNAHCVLLGHKYALKKTCLSCDASSFDESYASPGHNGKKSWFFTQRR